MYLGAFMSLRLIFFFGTGLAGLGTSITCDPYNMGKTPGTAVYEKISSGTNGFAALWGLSIDGSEQKKGVTRICTKNLSAAEGAAVPVAGDKNEKIIRAAPGEILF